MKVSKKIPIRWNQSLQLLIGMLFMDQISNSLELEEKRREEKRREEKRRDRGKRVGGGLRGRLGKDFIVDKECILNTEDRHLKIDISTRISLDYLGLPFPVTFIGRMTTKA